MSKSIGYFIGFGLIYIAYVAITGYATMGLWNAVLPHAIDGVKEINWFDGFCIVILCRILIDPFKVKVGKDG